ncbi:MAG: DUF434 domain-containing protein [Candidatus Hydrothermarchaeota archaeon]
MDLSPLRDPILDLRYLLDRGYRRATAIRVVGDGYRLGKRERNILLRAVFSRLEAGEHRRRRVGPEGAEEVVIDGYNVLITVEALLRGEAFLSDDGFVRDATGIYGKYRRSRQTALALGEILAFLKAHRSRLVRFFFDGQVSGSGELCALVRRMLREAGLSGDARTVKSADGALLRNRSKILATSDSAVIEKAERVLDIPYHLAPPGTKLF